MSSTTFQNSDEAESKSEHLRRGHVLCWSLYLYLEKMRYYGAPIRIRPPVHQNVKCKVGGKPVSVGRRETAVSTGNAAKVGRVGETSNLFAAKEGNLNDGKSMAWMDIEEDRHENAKRLTCTMGDVVCPCQVLVEANQSTRSRKFRKSNERSLFFCMNRGITFYSIHNRKYHNNEKSYRQPCNWVQ